MFGSNAAASRRAHVEHCQPLHLRLAEASPAQPEAPEYNATDMPIASGAPPWTHRYGFAVVIAATAAALRTALIPWLGTGFPYLLFFPAIMLASWRGGLGPGVLTTALTAIYSAFVFLGPQGSIWIDSTADRISFWLFIGIGTAIAWLHESVRRAERRHHLDEARLLAATADVERSQRRLQDLVADVPGVVWESWAEPGGDSRRLDFISDHVEGLLGYSREEWLNTPNFWRQVVHPDDQERAAREAHDIFTSGTTGTSEFRWVTRDGRIIWVEAQSRVVLDDQGRPVGMRGVTMDITARKRLEQEGQHLLAQAQRLNRIKDEFLATLSHELRTPINAVLGWAQMLQKGVVTGPRATQALEAIERNGMAQTRLIEELLDVSRIVTGKFRLEIEAFDIAATVRTAVEGVRPAATAKEITVLLEGANTPLELRGDPHRIQQAIWNVLANAVKFTPSRGSVTVTAARTSKEVHITVSDTGEGITADILPYVFDRFRQADSSASRAHSGLGLGLAIVRHIVELHGGRVNASSDGANQGATFRLALPFIAAAHESEALVGVGHVDVRFR